MRAAFKPLAASRVAPARRLAHNRAVVLTVIIFALTYVLIAGARVLPVGRPAAALVGAVLMVASGAMTPEESYRAIDGDTIALLLGMMLLSAELELGGFFGWASARVLHLAGSPRGLLVVLAVASALGSAVLVNDTVCLFMTPVVVATCRRASLPLAPYLIVLATSANLGSAATLVGNPQNMLIGTMSELPFARFFLAVGPVVVLAFVAHLGLALVFYRKVLPRAFGAVGSFEPSAALPAPPTPVIQPDRKDLARVGAVFLGVVVAFFAGAHLGYAALAGGALVLVLRGRSSAALFARVDWTLLVFFVGLFIVTGALRSTGLVDLAWHEVAPGLRLDDPGGLALFTGVMTGGSNVVSNVPMVVLTGPYLHTLGDAAFGYTLLAYVTTVAGNLTLVGSVANLIVAEGAREHHALGFFEYLRFGALSTALTLAIGVPLLAWWAPLVLG